VIDVAGNRGHPCAFRILPQHKGGGKKSDPLKPAKLQGQKSIKSHSFSKYLIKTVFYEGVDTISHDLKNGIVRLANGGRIGVIGGRVCFLGRDTVSLSGSPEKRHCQNRGSFHFPGLQVI